jgi:hypothetical protein
MANIQVSDDFAKFYGRAAGAVEEAKKAENTLSSSPTPVGWKGQAVLLGSKADKSKEREGADGTKSGGNPYVRMEFGIVGDEKFQGKKFTKNWTFFESANASAGDRFTWFLNELENMGLPRDIRENHESPQELLKAFADLDITFDVECAKDNYANDGKKMILRKPEEAVDGSDSMAPKTTTSSPEALDPKEGDEVPFLGSNWIVEARDGDHLQIKHPTRGSRREVTLSQLQG